MIAYLKGKILKKIQSSIIIEHNQVGYLLEIIDPEIFIQGDIYELWIHTHVREDSIRLFGFRMVKELELFNLLLTVSGVGPKAALAILGLSYETIVNGIISKTLSKEKITGVGKKTLEKVILELNSKMSDIDVSEFAETSTHHKVKNQVYTECIEALLQLGFKDKEIDIAYKNILEKHDITKFEHSSDLLKHMLKLLR